MKKYKIGMYGGKFMPFHKGHNYCIEFAAKECKKLYVILFYGGADEEKILKENEEEYLSVEPAPITAASYILLSINNPP